MIIPINESPRKKTENIMPVMNEYSIRRITSDDISMCHMILRIMNALIPPRAMMTNQIPNAEPPKMSAKMSKPYKAMKYDTASIRIKERDIYTQNFLKMFDFMCELSI